MNGTTRRLFSWVDVDDQLSAAAEGMDWPEWLQEVSAFWFELDIYVERPVPHEDVVSWLEHTLGPGTVRVSGEEIQVLLESPGGTSADGAERALDVALHVVGAKGAPPRVPLWKEPRITHDGTSYEALPSLRVPILAFHSYKGGVGRTTHAFAAALGIARGARVLLVDADMEAPGLSCLYQVPGFRAEFAYEDLLALLHGSVEGDLTLASQFARKFLANQTIGGIAFLPARRDLASLRPAVITPSDLLTAGRSPYFLSESIAALAETLAFDVVVMDLRAGASELSSQILLDPRVDRVLVTTASAQSIEGVSSIAAEIGRRAPTSVPGLPVPRLLVTQFHPATDDADLAALIEPVVNALTSEETASTQDQTTAGLESAPVFSRFQEQLLDLPGDWASVASLVERAGLIELTSGLLTTAVGPTDDLDGDGEVDGSDFDSHRERLADFAGPLAFAETTETQGFLTTQSLRTLTGSNQTELPICVVSGAKGAGKTFTQLQMVYRETWDAYAAATGVAGVEVEAPIVPVLTSRNLDSAVEGKVSDIRARNAIGNTPLGPLEVKDAIEDGIDQDISEREWRRLWLWSMARAAGLAVELNDAEEALISATSSSARLFVFDGLEDVLQDIAKSAAQQKALRVLLLDVLDWLRSVRGRPLGVVVFVRRDLVRSALRQNSEQFLSRYRAYDLAWDETEAVRLAAWVCAESDAIEVAAGRVGQLNDAELTHLMVPVWGEKMGTERSREARSRGWFLAALSDFNGGIQARDIVIFMAEAARASVDDDRWRDRLLAPAAMRTALIECSRQKIKAIGEETPRIRTIFDHLTALDDTERQVPISRLATGLELEDIQLLEENGIMFREEDRYWIPEIFRQGLGFRAVGRPRIVAVANLVRKRNNVD